MTKKNLVKMIDWATGDDTGASSTSILRYMIGLPCGKWGWQSPLDTGDRGRCIRLMKIFPKMYDRLDEMAHLSNDWKEQIELIKKDFSPPDLKEKM